ncbi:MAG: helix-turn-helix domain-containing protein [Syntrophaceae bacterium]|nr:helix-turn-helix domain-containing protein [Syntrophaceae bacterium]
MSQVLQEYQPETYIQFHKDIRFHPDLNFGEKLFYAEIESMSKHSNCPFSSRKMSKFFGVSHQTILNWVKKLVETGLLEIVVEYSEPSNLQTQFLRIKKQN